MNAVQPIVWPVSEAGNSHDPRWRLKVLGVRLATASMRVTSEFADVIVSKDGAVDRWSDALTAQDSRRDEFRAALEALTGMSVDLIERTLKL